LKLKAFYKKNTVEAGCDEAGRGCLAGPVVAAAVILPTKFKNGLLDDSKKLTEKNRLILRDVIEKEALSYAVAFVDNNEIDTLNILKASFIAMHRALDNLNQVPELILVDGNRFISYNEIPHECIIKGDGKFLSIAAASILAKTYRDEYMEKVHQDYPEYQWMRNKGYPTKIHRAAIKKYGSTPLHRNSFKLLPEEQLKMNF
jgi:ribonuclease HII